MWLAADFLESDRSSIHHRPVDELDRVHHDDNFGDVGKKIDGGKRSTAMTIYAAISVKVNLSYMIVQSR